MSGWEDELERWLMPFLDQLGHKRIKKVSVEIALSIKGKGFYLRRLTAKQHGNTHVAAVPGP